MDIKLGPVLGFRGSTYDLWSVSILIVCNNDVQASDLKILPGCDLKEPTLLRKLDGLKVWVFEAAIARTNSAQDVTYSVGQRNASFKVPPKGADPRIAFTSCNGFSTPAAMKKIKLKNERWNHMAQEHGREPFHLLCMGGDQVYADSIWEVIPELKEWTNLAWKERVSAPLSVQLDSKIEAYYFHLYCERWSQPEVATMLASVPTIMMWDDHDIFDGWGSYPEELQNCPVYKGIFNRANEFFCIFQQMTAREAKGERFLPQQDAYSQAYSFESISLAVLDLRSERTLDQVLSAKSWNSFYSWLSGNSKKHLLLVLSIPLVYPDFALLEKLLGFLPGQQELEDDLQDHWSARSHREERLRLIHRLLAHSAASNSRITILSGDVHVAALGLIESTRSDGIKPNAKVINQLISSAIVHPPPPAIAAYFLKQISDNVENVDRGITTQMLQFPGLSTQFIAKRNYLSLTLDDTGRIWAHWHVEGEKTPITKVINPC